MRRATRRPSLGERVFAALLRALPGDFHGDFGGAMADAASRRPDEAWWTREIPGLAAAIVREHASGMWRDLVDGSRDLTRTPGFTAAAIVMLAVGTGANAAVFSVIDAVLLRPVFPGAASLARVDEVRPDGAVARSVTLEGFRRIAARPDVAGAFGVSGRIAWVERPGGVGRVDVECATSGLFPVLGVRPALGRAFDDSDDRPGAAPVVVIGDRMWRRDYGARPDVLGERLTLAGVTSTIVGVMPQGFLGPFADNHTEAWVPLGPSLDGRTGGFCTSPIRRVALVVRTRAPLPPGGATIADAGARFELHRLDAASLDGFEAPLAALMATGCCVLLIACANVASLQLERLAGRRREIAVRLALGAGRWRLVRQSVMETVLLSAAGALAGLLTARPTVRLLARLAPPELPHVGEIGVDLRALAFTTAIALAAGVAVGLVPFVTLRRAGVADALRGSGRTIVRGAARVGRGLAALEIALSAALVVGAVLMIRSLVALGPGDLGFDPGGRVVAEASVADGALGPTGRAVFARDVVERLARLPGVRAAAASSYLPLDGYTESAPVDAGGPSRTAWLGWFTPGFPAVIGARLVAGRDFDRTDAADAPAVAIVNETLARAFFGDGPAVGRTLTVTLGPQRTTRRVVGVIADLREGGRDRVQRPELYAPFSQAPGIDLFYFVLRTDAPISPALAGDVRDAVRAVRPGQLLYRLEPLDRTVTRAFARARFGVWLFGVLAAIALALAGMGLAAVIAWWVSERRGEMALRLALGATGGEVARTVVKEGMLITSAGVVAGLGAALAGSRLLEAWLFGVRSYDMATFATGAAVMLVVAAVAAWIPARRVARIDPVTVLRGE